MVEIVEGATRLDVPGVNAAHGPGAIRDDQPFYNPGMALNRDLSVLLVAAERARRGRELDVADVLAGAGARSVRLANEVAGIVVHANDRHPLAVASLVRAAATHPALQVTEADAHAFLSGRRYDVVDLDPYGSPMPFVDAAMRATRPGGLLCVSATDTGALAGRYPRVAWRRYGARHLHHAAPWRAEVGLRILAGAVIRAAARADRVASPVLSVCRNHWMRVVVRVGEGKERADAVCANLGYVATDADGRGVFERDGGADRSGPLWTGPLHDASLVAALDLGRPLARHAEAALLVDHLRGEADPAAAPFWIVPDAYAKRLGTPPRRDVLIAALQDAGVPAARTHMDAQGVRTAADLETLRRVWKPQA